MKTHINCISLETTYKQFHLGDLPIFQNMEKISIGRLFWILTNTQLKDLSTIEAMNFYLYCNFFKNRLLYSIIFKDNLTYIDSKALELTHMIKNTMTKYDHMLKEAKSESDGTWLDNNLVILNDGLSALNLVTTRCDYYDAKVRDYIIKYNAQVGTPELAAIEAECGAEFSDLSMLFIEVGRLIGREF